MQSSFKKSLLVVVVAFAAQGTITAGVRKWLCEKLDCATVVKETPAATVAVTTAPAVVTPAVKVAAAVPVAVGVGAGKAAIAAGTEVAKQAAEKTTQVQSYPAWILAGIKSGAITTWDYTLGSLWNLRAPMTIADKITPTFYANFAKSDPYHLATIIRGTAKIGIAVGTLYAGYLIANTFFGKQTKQAKKKVARKAADVAHGVAEQADKAADKLEVIAAQN